MGSVFKILAGISRPNRSPIEFRVDADVTIKEVAAKERTEQWIDNVVKMLMFGYNESFLNVYRGVFGGILLPFVLGVIMFFINFFVDSWAVSLTISPLTVIPAMLVYLNRLKVSVFFFFFSPLIVIPAKLIYLNRLKVSLFVHFFAH